MSADSADDSSNVSETGHISFLLCRYHQRGLPPGCCVFHENAMLVASEKVTKKVLSVSGEPINATQLGDYLGKVSEKNNLSVYRFPGPPI